MTERRLAGIPLDQRLATNNTETPRMCQIRVLFHAMLQQEIPEDVFLAIIKFAERRKKEIRNAMEGWNQLVQLSYIIEESEIEDLAIEVCATYGILGDGRFKSKSSDKLKDRARLLAEAAVKLIREEKES